MDLMTLAAKITLDDSSYIKGVGNAEKMGQQLAGKMSAMTVAVGNLAADMIKKAVSGIGQVVNGAIDGYADYQQLIGGVETLFKTSADKVSKYAQQSYKTTGLSANQYMETVTSFSASLLQGLKGDTETAAEMANMAVTDMADNANKMGTDISSIQAAYQGFAKQNYTMLDNLKLGYGGTAGEMVRLVNDSKILDHEIENLDDITFDQLVAAIHAVQSELGVTGTTAAEAKETLAGSKNSLKAAWADLLSAVGGEGDQERLDTTLDNFKSSFSTYMEQFIPTLVKTIGNSGTLVTAIADSIADLPTDLLSQVADAGLDTTTDVVNSASKIINWMIDSLVDMFTKAKYDTEGVKELGSAIGELIGTGISTIVTNGGTILTGILEIGKGLATGLVDGLIDGLFGEDREIDRVKGDLDDALTTVDTNFFRNSALIMYLKNLYEERGAAATATQEWKDAVAELKQSMPEAENIFKNFGNDIDGAIEHLDWLNERMRTTSINNALMTAMQDEYALLTEQSLSYNKEVSRYRRNASMLQTYTEPLRNALVERATSMNENGIEDGIMQQRVNNILNGFVEIGNELYKLEDLDLTQLQDQINDLFYGATPKEYKFDEYIKEHEGLVAEARSEMELAKSAAEKWQEEIAATELVIEDTKTAMAQTATDLGISGNEVTSGLLKSGGDVEKGIAGAGAMITSAMAVLANRMLSLKISARSMLNPGFTTEDVDLSSYFHEATGIDYVPYSGFRAELHRGEAVLTASENEARRNGAGSNEMIAELQGLRNDLQNLKLIVGEKAFGRAVVDYSGRRVRDYIGQAEKREASGYGV